MNFFHTHISAKAIELAAETLRSTFVSEGKRVRQFEEELSHSLGLVRPVAVNSGTSALHLALSLPASAPATRSFCRRRHSLLRAFAILMCGAKPVFADVQPSTGNLDPALAARQDHAPDQGDHRWFIGAAILATWTRSPPSRSSMSLRWSRTPRTRSAPPIRDAQLAPFLALPHSPFKRSSTSRRAMEARYVVGSPGLS